MNGGEGSASASAGTGHKPIVVVSRKAVLTTLYLKHAVDVMEHPVVRLCDAKNIPPRVMSKKTTGFGSVMVLQPREITKQCRFVDVIGGSTSSKG